MVVLIGFVSFWASFGLLMVFAFHWTTVVIRTISDTVRHLRATQDNSWGSFRVH
jgi:hypothetical protein